MSKLDDLKEKIKVLTDKLTETEDLKMVGAISNTIEQIEAENKEANDKYDSLFKDYRDLVKTQAFKVENTTPLDDGNKKEVALEDYFKEKK